MTPAQLEALARMCGASAEISRAVSWATQVADPMPHINAAVAYARIITEAAADLSTETVRAQLSASLATGAE